MANGLKCLVECKAAWEKSATPENLGTDLGCTRLRDIQTWISHTEHYTTKLHNQNSMVLALKWKHRPLELHRQLRSKPCTYGQLINNKGGKNIQWRKDRIPSKWYLGNWIAMCRRMRLDHFLTPFIKVNSLKKKD